MSDLCEAKGQSSRRREDPMRLTFEKECRRPPDRLLPPRDVGAEYVVQIPDEEPEGKRERSGADGPHNGRSLRFRQSLRNCSTVEEVGSAEGGGKEQGSEDDLVIYGITPQVTGASE